jgi:hypothetical protein
MLILALTRKGQEQFNGQVPKDDQGDPVVSSSSVVPKSSSSQVVPPSSSSVMGIQQVRTPQMHVKETRTFNAKGEHVKEVRNRYRVNFKY